MPIHCSLATTRSLLWNDLGDTTKTSLEEAAKTSLTLKL